MSDDPRSRNLTWHAGRVTREARAQRLGHQGAVLWLTGLSGSGKSTLSRALEEALLARGALAYVLDGDNLRHGLNRDLGFSEADRTENIRRVGEVARLMVDAGLICVTAFISPYRADRAQARALIGSEAPFFEVYVKTPLEVCEQRDPKQLYRKARAGEIKNFTGLDAPYEEPENPELVVETHLHPLETCVAQVLAALEARGILRAGSPS
jgi:adenylylsulfate kinase